MVIRRRNVARRGFGARSRPPLRTPFSPPARQACASTRTCAIRFRIAATQDRVPARRITPGTFTPGHEGGTRVIAAPSAHDIELKGWCPQCRKAAASEHHREPVLVGPQRAPRRRARSAGWTIAVAPAAATASRPSANGKNASDATLPSTRPPAFITATFTASTGSSGRRRRRGATGPRRMVFD